MGPSTRHDPRLRRALPAGAAACALALLAGCTGSPTQLVSMGLNTISFLATGRSVSDHAVSVATDRDCMLLRITEGDPVCLPRADLPAPVLALAGRDLPSRPPAGGPVDASLSSSSANGAGYDTHALDGLVTYLVVANFTDAGEAYAYRARHRSDLLHVLPVYAYGVRGYRVIAGPVREGRLLRTLAEIESEGLGGGWMLRLCPDTLLAPPCGDRLSPDCRDARSTRA